MSSPSIVIGSEASDHLSVTVTRREFDDLHDYWDGNWVYATVRIRAGAFGGEYEELLRTDELAVFATELRRLHADVHGTAAFHTMEHWLEIDVVGDGYGHFTARCEARDEPGIGNTLRFELTFELSELRSIVASLDAVVVAFPVRGTRGS
jgi:hypothetical protein